MKKIDQVLKGYIKLYPKSNGKYIKIELIADRKDNDDFTKVFGDIKYDDVKKKRKQENNQRKRSKQTKLNDCIVVNN